MVQGMGMNVLDRFLGLVDCGGPILSAAVSDDCSLTDRRGAASFPGEDHSFLPFIQSVCYSLSLTLIFAYKPN